MQRVTKRKAGYLLSILVTDLVQAWVGRKWLAAGGTLEFSDCLNIPCLCFLEG